MPISGRASTQIVDLSYMRSEIGITAFNQSTASICFFGVTVYAQVPIVAHVWRTRRCSTHTCVTPNTWQREVGREWWPSSSLCRDRARCRCILRFSKYGELRTLRNCPWIVAKRYSSTTSERRSWNNWRSWGNWRSWLATARLATGWAVIFPRFPGRNVGLHHRLFLHLRRITAPGAADDDTPGWVQAFQIFSVRNYYCFLSLSLCEEMASRKEKIFFSEEKLHREVSGKIILHPWGCTNFSSLYHEKRNHPWGK